MHRRPVRLGLPAMTPPGGGTGTHPLEGPAPPRRAIARRGIPAAFNLITSRTWRTASLSVGIQVPFAKPKGRTVSEPEQASSPRAKSSRNGGRDHLEMGGAFTTERWARSFRNSGRHRAESAVSDNDNFVVIGAHYRYLGRVH